MFKETDEAILIIVHSKSCIVINLYFKILFIISFLKYNYNFIIYYSLFPDNSIIFIL